ncbi:hypothetical protein, partial [Halomonas colorata]|uniref:hypothetical protein n=1 Tax=Halomonas colorata TaxID=2742615 RepID=UPI001CE3FF53
RCSRGCAGAYHALRFGTAPRFGDKPVARGNESCEGRAGGTRGWRRQAALAVAPIRLLHHIAQPQHRFALLPRVRWRLPRATCHRVTPMFIPIIWHRIKFWR